MLDKRENVFVQLCARGWFECLCVKTRNRETVGENRFPICNMITPYSQIGSFLWATGGGVGNFPLWCYKQLSDMRMTDHILGSHQNAELCVFLVVERQRADPSPLLVQTRTHSRKWLLTD